MIILGLTGSIGMGKSATGAMFEAEGCPLYDADAEVHRVYAKGGAAVGPVGEAFAGVIRDGAVDRAALSAQVVGDHAAMDRLNRIVHPLLGVAPDLRADAARAAGISCDCATTESSHPRSPGSDHS